MQKIDIGIYIILGLCIVGLLGSSFLQLDAALLTPITWALLGVVLGRNADNISNNTQRVLGVGAFKKK